MVQIPPDSMGALRQALRDQADFQIPCGRADSTEARENVTIRWVDWSPPVNAGYSLILMLAHAHTHTHTGNTQTCLHSHTHAQYFHTLYIYKLLSLQIHLLYTISPLNTTHTFYFT